MDRDGLATLLRDRRTNAIAGWILVALVLVAGVGSFLRGNLLWTVFTAAVIAIAVLPAVSLRNPQVMPPWEVMLMASLPIVGRLFTTTLVTGRIATYLSVAALALLVAVDLDTFTPVEMNDAFAVLFVVVTTLATAGVWAVVRWLADLFLGTGFIQTEHALMLEFVASTIAGIVAGLTYVFYIRRRTKPELRLPEEVEIP
jgi:hypothetical protein